MARDHSFRGALGRPLKRLCNPLSRIPRLPLLMSSLCSDRDWRPLVPFSVLSSLKTRVRCVLVAQEFTRIEHQSRRTVADSRCSEDDERSSHT